MITSLITKFRNISTNLLFPLKCNKNFNNNFNNYIGSIGSIGGIGGIGCICVAGDIGCGDIIKNNYLTKNNNNSYRIKGRKNKKINKYNKSLQESLKKVNNNNKSPGLFFSLFVNMKNLKLKSIKLLNGTQLDIKDVIICEINNNKKNRNKKSTEKYILELYLCLLKLLQGFTYEYVLIGYRKYNKLDLLSMVLINDPNNEHANYLIQQYLLFKGDISYTLDNDRIINAKNELNFVVGFYKCDDLNNQLIVRELVEKIENYDNIIKTPCSTNTIGTLSTDIQSPSSFNNNTNSLFGLYHKLFNNLDMDDVVKLHGKTMNKMDIVSQLVKLNGVPSTESKYSGEVSIKTKSVINDHFLSCFNNKYYWLLNIEAIPKEMDHLFTEHLSICYFNLSLLLNGFTKHSFLVYGKPMNKLDLLLKSFDLSHQNHQAKEMIEFYLFATGKSSIPLLNKKLLELDHDN